MSADHRSIEVLHVDDEPGFAEMTARFLERHDERITVATATRAEEGLRLFERTGADCIVSDFEMPDMTGLEFLEAIREDHSGFPFVLYTGKGTEAIASQAISSGVTDYLQKGGSEVYPVLVNRIVNAVEQHQSRTELRRFHEAVEQAGHAIYMTDEDGVIRYVNPTFEAVTGYSEPEAVGRTPEILNSGEHDPDYFRRLWETISNGDVWNEEVVNRRRNGDLYTARQTIAPITEASGPTGYVAIQQDVSEY